MQTNIIDNLIRNLKQYPLYFAMHFKQFNVLFLFILLKCIVLTTGQVLGSSCTTYCGTIDASCKYGVCECNNLTVQHNGHCLQIIESSEHCNSNADCKPSYGERTICKNNICVCKEYHHQQNVGYEHPQCLKNKGLHENCLTHEDCYYGYDMLDKIRCKQGVCSCIHGYFIRGRKCSNSSNANSISLTAVLTFSLLIRKIL